jgi:predicted nucleotidyltransferase
MRSEALPSAMVLIRCVCLDQWPEAKMSQIVTWNLLVEFELGRSLMDQVAMMLEIEDLLQSRVDIVDVVALHPSIKQRVLAEAVAL